MRTFLSLALVLATTASAPAADATVRLTKKQEAVEVTVGGQLFTVYNFGKELPKPFFSPVYGLGGGGGSLEGRKVRVTADNAELKVENSVVGTVKAGEVLEGSVVNGEWLWIPGRKAYVRIADVQPLPAVLTRPIDPNEKEHKHHKGIWVSIDEVNDVKFWAEQGKIENAAVELVKAEGDPAVLRVVNRWLGEEGKVEVTEETTVSIYADGLFAYDITFRAGDEPTTFDDTKEGLFGIRMAHTMRETEGGQVISAEGIEGTKDNWGGYHRWIDYYGQVDGQTWGLTLFDHPLNFRPSRYHVRNYGLFTLSPFGQKSYTGGKQPAEPLTLPPGGTLRMRYGLYVHPGDTEQGQVPRKYIEYLQRTAS